MKLNKAAMFGLDARIALAIFGALSVISGAALYSAIQQSKATTVLVTLQELNKSSEAYLLDTGTNMPLVASENLNMHSLTTDNSVAGWNGPYTSLVANSSTALKYQDILIYAKIRKLSTWTTAANAFPDSCVVNNSDCGEWFFLYSSAAAGKSYIKTMFNALDQMVDSGDGADAGNVRFREEVSTSNRLYLKGITRKRLS
tara:strand:+ start:1114 stop:1713 length:600 start_codon:yes stop_codon:yes gene_type:complete